MADAGFEARVAALRAFNRFYTARIGGLGAGRLDSPYSPTEARVMYELAHRPAPTAAAIARDLPLDPGYLSRILARFAAAGLVARRPAARDRRRAELALTAKGRRVFAPLERRARDQAAALLAPLAPAEQARLMAALATVGDLIAPAPSRPPALVLRPHRIGDLGWIVHRHAVLYAAEHGWNAEFEALVAEIVARFIRRHDPARERCWMAERDGAVVGSATVVAKSRTVAQLRLVYVEPAARGLGLGRRLVEEAIAFARGAGYRTMTLWTNDILHAARRIYEAEGFRLVKEERHRSFGRDLVGQYWALAL